MAQLVVKEDVRVFQDSEDEDMQAADVNNYKGMYEHEEEEPEQKYFEFGAHFCYQLLYEKLEVMTLRSSRRESGTSVISYLSPIMEKEQHFRKPAGTSQALSNANNLSQKLSEPVIADHKFFISMNLTNNTKSRNVNNMDKDNVYKPGTGLLINNFNLYNINKANIKTNIEQTAQNTSTNLAKKIISNANANKKEKEKEKEDTTVSKVFNVYNSFTNDVLNLNSQSGKINQKFNGPSFKKSVAVVLMEEKKKVTIASIANKKTTLTSATGIVTINTMNAINNYTNAGTTNINSNVKINLGKVEAKSTSKPSTTKSQGKLSVQSIQNVISTYNTKVGRNLGSELNPHNTTNNSTLKTSTLKKLNLMNVPGNKSDAYRYITSSMGSVDNSSISRSKLTNLNNRNVSSSPFKMDSSRVMMGVKVQEQPEATDTCKTPNLGLNEIFSTLSKNETKSRNAPRNNLTSTKSNLFISDKAQSMQSGSYQKNHMFTQMTVKTATNASVLVKTKIASINKTTASYVTHKLDGKDKSMNLNKSKTNFKMTSSKVTIKVNNQVNIITNNNQSLMMKKIMDSGTGGTNCTSSVTSPAVNASLNANLKNCLFKGISPNKTKLIANNYMKIDSSKFKTKSNSVTSNISNGVISSTPTNPTNSLIKNYYFNKNSKLSNVSLLNIKKIDCSVKSVNAKISMSSSEKNSVAFINTLSSACLEKRASLKM